MSKGNDFGEGGVMETGLGREPRRNVGIGEWTGDALIIVLAVALPRLVELGTGRVPGASDLGTLFLPNWAWWWETSRWWGGWNPWIFSGYPADGDPLTSRFHPLSLLYGAWSPGSAAALEAFLLEFLGAFGMLAYLRRLGCGRVASLLGALAFGMGGYVASNGVHPAHLRSAVAIPWGLLVFESLAGAGLVAGVAAVVGWVLLGGHPQTIFYSLGLLGVYALWLGRPLAPGRLPAMVGGGLVGALLGAALWVPALRWITSTTRWLGTPPFPDPRLVPEQWYWLFTPFQSLFSGATADGLGDDVVCGVVECGGYPGLVVWLLLGMAVPFLLRDTRGRFWLFVAGFSLLAAGGLVPLPFMRGPSRILLWWSVACAALVGLGFAHFTRQWTRGRWGSLVGALVVVDALVIFAASRQPWSWASFFLAQAVLALAVLIVTAGPRRWGWLVVLLVGELAAFQWFVVPFSTSRDAWTALQAPLVTAERVLERAPSFAVDNPRVLFLPAPLSTNWASHRKVPVVHGYNLLVPRWYAAALGQDTDLGLESIGYVDDPALARPSNHVLDLLRVGLVLRDPRLPSALGDAIAQRATPGGRWERGEDTERGLEVYWNRGARPVAWLVGATRDVSAGDATELLRGTAGEEAFDPARQALVHEPVAMGTAAVSGRVRVDSSSEDELRLSVQASAPALLVTSELAAPGWEVEVNGDAGRVQIANGGFRAVVVPSGSSDVLFRYAPRLAWVGMALSLLGLLVLLVVTVRAVWSGGAVLRP